MSFSAIRSLNRRLLLTNLHFVSASLLPHSGLRFMRRCVVFGHVDGLGWTTFQDIKGMWPLLTPQGGFGVGVHGNRSIWLAIANHTNCRFKS